MRVRALLLISTMTAGLATTASSASAEAVHRNLADLIVLARARAGNVAVAQAELSVAQAKRAETVRLWAPTGEFTYFLTGAPRVRCQAPEGLSPLPGETDEQFRTRNCVNTVDPNGDNVSFINPNIAGVAMQGELELTQPIYTFGKIENAVKAADQNIKVRSAGVEAAKREAEVNVIRAYWGLKTARASRDTVKDARDEVAPWVKKIEEELDEGEGRYTETDLQRLKVALTQIDIVIANLERAAVIAKAALRPLVGEEVDIDDSELAPIDKEDRPLVFYLTAAQVNRPELKQVEAGVSALRSIAKARRAEMFPDLALVGGLNFRYAPTIEDSQSAFVSHANQIGFGLFLALRQPLDIIIKHSRMKHAQAEAGVMAAQRNLAKDGVAFEVAKVHADLTEVRRRLELADRGQRVARGWLNAVRQNMDLGTVEARDLVDSARSYFELRLAYFQAIMDFNITQAQLRRAAGMDQS